MPKRSYSGAGSYRYGFNGKENDNDVKGLGNQQDYGMRIYDARLGRFLSKDPLAPKYPYYSPYQFAGNMPIWVIDVDGMEPGFKYNSNGIFGVGNFDQVELGGVKIHSTVLRIGSKDKQFQIQWLLNDNGETIGYLASRVIPEEEYKYLYGGSGQGLQAAYVIDADKFFEFGKSTDALYDKSRNSELNDVLYGQIERDPIKSLFDPRGWLLGQVAGATGKLSGQLFNNLLARAGTMTNAEVRVWYNIKLSRLNTKVSATEANARVLHDQRNSIKADARALMKDRKAAAALDKSDPIHSFDYYVDKYKKLGYKDESLWKKIIEGSAKPNSEVNSRLGIK